MQLDHEIDERAFQFCTGASKTDKTAPAEFCRPLGIEKIQSCAERDVISRLGKSRFLAPAANDPVCAGIFANWNALMWQVCNLKKQIVLLGLGSSRLHIENSNLIADFANAFLQLIGRFASRKFFADLLTQAVAVGIQLLQHRFQFAAFHICTQDLIDFRFIAAAARRESRTHEIGLDRKSTRLNSSHITNSYAVFCLKKKKEQGRRLPPSGIIASASSLRWVRRGSDVWRGLRWQSSASVDCVHLSPSTCTPRQSSDWS